MEMGRSFNKIVGDPSNFLGQIWAFAKRNGIFAVFVNENDSFSYDV